MTEDKIILGCEDSSIILYDVQHRVTLLAQAELLPAVMCCHPCGSVILAGSSQGELQLFDMALSPIKIQLLAEDFSPKSTLQCSEHLDVSSSLVHIQWAAPEVPSPSLEAMNVHDLLLLRFDKGPIAGLRFKVGKSKHYCTALLLLVLVLLFYTQSSQYCCEFFIRLN